MIAAHRLRLKELINTVQIFQEGHKNLKKSLFEFFKVTVKLNRRFSQFLAFLENIPP